MSCAGCDDCPQGAWHLHVTVGAVHNGFWAVGEEHELVRSLGYKLVLVANIMADGSSYNELIPTANFVGTEAKATHALFEMGSQLLRVGLEVKRLKIEGHPDIVSPCRALYYEAHAKIRAKNTAFFRYKGWAISQGSTNLMATYRCPEVELVRRMLQDVRDYTLIEVPRIEACVLDTAPELDHAWMGIAA